MPELRTQRIGDLFDPPVPGEWGSDPDAVGSLATVFRSTDIDDDGHVVEEHGGVLRRVSPDKLAAKALVAGDILLEASGGSPDRPVGRVGRFGGSVAPALAANFLRTLRPKRALSSAFLTSALVWFHRQPAIWRFQQQTTGIINLKVTDYLAHKLTLPCEEEHEPIAEVFAAIDDAIAQTEALIAKMQQVKAGLTHDLFTRGIGANGQLRPTRVTNPVLYQPSQLGWIPAEWRTSTLAERRPMHRAHLQTGPFGSSLKLEHWVAEGWPVITIGALGEGEFITSELLYVSDATAARLREYQLKVGDVVFSRVADVGRSAVIGREQEGWIMSSNLMRITLDPELVNPSFLHAQLAYDRRIRDQIRANVNVGGREVANSATLNRLCLAWPPLREQERIIEQLDAIDARRAALSGIVRGLKAQKLGLMDDLLTGRVRVPH